MLGNCGRGDPARHLAVSAGVRRRFAPHQLRHAHAVEMARDGAPLVVIQRQLGHANLGVTSIYLEGIDSSEIINAVRHRPALDSNDGPLDRGADEVCVPTPTRVRERTRADVMPPASPHRGAARDQLGRLLAPSGREAL